MGFKQQIKQDFKKWPTPDGPQRDLNINAVDQENETNICYLVTIRINLG